MNRTVFERRFDPTQNSYILTCIGEMADVNVQQHELEEESSVFFLFCEVRTMKT